MVAGLSGRRLELLRELVRAARGRTDVGLDSIEVALGLGIETIEASHLQNWLSDRGYIEVITISRVNLTALAIDTIEELDQEVATAVGGTMPMTRDARKVFIIYGRNEKAFAAMRDFVRSLGLDPSDFNRLVADRGGSPYVGQVIGESMREAQAMVALFTPDERSELRLEHQKRHDRLEDRVRWQARPNVILEAGMALAIDEARTILVTIGDVSLSSDIDGRHIVRMNNTTAARDLLKGRFEGVGCSVKASSDWIEQGDFDGAVAGLSTDSPSAAVSAPSPSSRAPTASAADAALLLREWAREHQGSHHFADVDAALNLEPGLTAQVLGQLSDKYNVERGDQVFVIRPKPMSRVHVDRGGGGRI